MSERIQPEECVTRPGATTWMYEQLEAATRKIDNDAIEIRRLQRQVTELQSRGNGLLEEARAARREARGLRRVLEEAIGLLALERDARAVDGLYDALDRLGVKEAGR